ncbi:UvrABC system protein B [Arthrobacter saudimassiliensis]|uniref:UvrABC system protein B n=1 Tax=Arthrobacter saudimassiliensis TaxID=1461584 RepID=A0A078MXZ7_9MICC|nr:UvrABC system protein B [Arthrobacter saudimassiliensis]
MNKPGGDGGLVHGLYETLHTRQLQDQLDLHPTLQAVFESVSDDESPALLAEHVAARVREVLAGTKPEDRVSLTNNILQQLSSDTVQPGPHQLLSAFPADTLKRRQLRRPTTPLRKSALLTNGKDDPNLAAELRAEMGSADRVDLLCAFIRWTGLRLLEPALEDLRDRGIPIRVITSTYMGATERRAIDELVVKYGAEVRINYETHATRLHAKAWLFRRNTGFDTAYVGSSNLSAPAMLDGLEWNVRLSSVGTPELLQKFEITFDSYWQQPAFQTYDPARDGDKLDAALARNGGSITSLPAAVTGLEIQPYVHQQEMLEELDAAREVQGHHRNLLVAATGTGKTVIAALDYKRLCEAAGRPLSLLFVAHRKEILEQSLRTYRDVMQSGSFGELFVGDNKPAQWKQVFASVQSLAALGVGQLDADAFDVVVIDEFHHAQAPTYRRLIDHLRPQELLGLTATPERGDGVNVAEQFFDGRVASELRLWDALDADLLVPFHYFGVADDVDLSQVEWKRGNYDVGQLSNLYTGNDARAAKVITELRDKVSSTQQMRALGFCVSVQHAEYMAKVFNRAGIPSVAVSGDTPGNERADALRRLRNRELNCIFAVDLFNEGLDLPEVDTIMLLRPTQSSTVFLQQLGRGLRRAKDKSVLTVLDYIGQQHREFRFETKLRALTGLGRKPLAKAVEDEFPHLPSGSQIVLDRVAQKIILDNIRAQLRFNKRQLIADVKSHGELRLEGFLQASGLSSEDIYRKTGDSWTALLRGAGLVDLAYGPETVVAGKPTVSVAEEALLLRRMTTFLCVDDPERAETYARLVSDETLRYDQLGDREQTLARMLFFALWPEGGGFEDYDAGLDFVRALPPVVSEIQQLMELGIQRSRYSPKGLGRELQYVPLYSHATYRREEVLAALGYLSLEGRRARHREGVAWCEDTKTDAFFVTLEKDAKDRAASIMYKDYAMSPEVFHWESQNATFPESPTGKRYLDHKKAGSQVLLFTRPRENDDSGLTMPYTCLGQMDYMSHTGSKPIAITWKLHRPMPGDVYVDASAVAL